MDSPFIDSLTYEAVINSNFEDTSREVFIRGPLLDPFSIEPEEQTLTGDLAENWTPPTPSGQRKVGKVIFGVADAGIDGTPEYRELVSSGNPLLIITPKQRPLKISENFTVGELTQAQSGQYKWNYARIDPALVEAIQQLRSFLGKGINIVDGYYTPKYLQQVLNVKDSIQLKGNSHISGRGVKISVSGFDNAIKQLAMAAIVACGTDIHVSIGNSTMTLAVKKPVDPSRNIDGQRITSYIKEEKYKVENYNFCIDFKNLLYDQFAVYETHIHKATAALAVNIMKMVYRENSIAPELADWQTQLKKAISAMYGLSKTKNPNVILYALAYSPFGYLFRHFHKDTSAFSKQTIDSIIGELTTENDKQVSGPLNSFLGSLRNENKTEFLNICSFRIGQGKKPDGSPYRLVARSFFDWMHHAKDKIFLTTITAIIKEVYTQNRYTYNEPMAQLPQGGTNRNFVISVANPDRPALDFTGRYFLEFPADNQQLYGRFLLLNQSGNYISGKFGGIYKSYTSRLKNTIVQFYGKINDKGIAICDLYPQQTIILKKDTQGRVQYTIINNPTDQITWQAVFSPRKKSPVLSAQVLEAFSKLNAGNGDLILTLAWAMPLPSQVRAFLTSLKNAEPEVTNAIKEYYDVEENMPSVRKSKLERAFKKLVSGYASYRLQNYDQFINYFTRHFYSITKPWAPRSDRESMSKLAWIKRMMEDYRDFQGSKYIETNVKDFYAKVGVDTQTPPIVYTYSVDIKTTAMGIGPFARLSGTITINNITDFAKYPSAEKWDKAQTYPITLWNATLSLSPLKWRPKISAGAEMSAKGTISIPYHATDFSGAEIEVTEGTAFNVAASVKVGPGKIGIDTGLTQRIVLVSGHGKKRLDLEELDTPGIPDNIITEVEYSKEEDPGIVSVDFSLPSLSFYKGEIGTKKITTVINTIPLPDSFTTAYQLQSTNYFKHDDAVLSAGAIDAIGRMAAEELISFSDPNCELEIYGYTDASGKPEYNLDLSDARAKNTLQAIRDRLGNKFKITVKSIKGLGETEANEKLGQFTQKNAWLRKVIVIVNGRAVLSLGEV